MVKALKASLAAVALALMAAAPASAATVIIDSSTQGAGNDAGIGYAIGYGANTPLGATWSADPTWTPPNGNVGGQSQSPFNNTALLQTQDYFTVGGTSVPEGGAPSPVTLTFSAVQDSFRILWGSIDSYNTIEFYLGAALQDSLNGTQLVALGSLGGVAANFEQVALVDFSGFTFDSVRFVSTQAAFEFALAPIPLPAGGLLLLGALGGVALLRRRKAA